MVGRVLTVVWYGGMRRVRGRRGANKGLGLVDNGKGVNDEIRGRKIVVRLLDRRRMELRCKSRGDGRMELLVGAREREDLRLGRQREREGGVGLKLWLTREDGSRSMQRRCMEEEWGRLEVRYAIVSVKDNCCVRA